MIIIVVVAAIVTMGIGFIAAMIFGQNIQTTMIYVGLGTLLASLVAAVTFLFGYRREKEREKKAPTLEDRITALTENFKSSLSVISEIEAEIGKRSEIAEKLKNDVQRYEQLRELNQPQVEAIAQTIRSEIMRESRKSIWRNAIMNFLIALVFFFIGWWVGSF